MNADKSIAKYELFLYKIIIHGLVFQINNTCDICIGDKPAILF